MPEEPTIGQIILFAGGWTPSGYIPCDGRALNIFDYQALYSLLGVRYGGDGQTSFNVPDLRDRVPVHYGSLDGTGPYHALGQGWGSDSITLRTLPVSAEEDPDKEAAAVAPSGTVSTTPAYGRVAYYIAGAGVYPQRT